MIARMSHAAVGIWLAAATPALAHDYTLGPLHVVHPWARATLGGAEVAGGYMKVENKGGEPDRLVSASSEIAARVELHDMKVEDGIMKMQALKDGLAIAPGGTAEFKPGSYHVMFMGLKAPLKQGERFKATLVFEKAGKVEVEFAIDAAGAKEPAGHVH